MEGRNLGSGRIVVVVGDEQRIRDGDNHSGSAKHSFTSPSFK